MRRLEGQLAENASVPSPFVVACLVKLERFLSPTWAYRLEIARRRKYSLTVFAEQAISGDHVLGGVGLHLERMSNAAIKRSCYIASVIIWQAAGRTTEILSGATAVSVCCLSNAEAEICESSLVASMRVVPLDRR